MIWTRSLICLSVLIALSAACSGATTNNEANNSADNNQPNNAKNNAQDMGGQDMTETPKPDAWAGLVINEVAAAGEPSDWFELYNGSDKAIDLSGVTYTDDPALPAQATFAQGTMLAAGAYLQVFVDDTGAGFKLGSDEQLALYSPSGVELAVVDWDEGASPATKSFGRFPDGAGEFKTLNTPTPGAKNVDNTGEQVVCGDDVAAGDEPCDGVDLKGQSCQLEGFGGGLLSCKADCKGFDTSACEPAVAPGKVVINELTSAGDDQIELYNAGDQAVVLTGWYMGDSGYNPADPEGTAAQRHDLEPGQTLEPKGYLVIPKTLPAGDRFGLGKQDAVTLYNDKDEVIDQVSYPDQAAETSYCRIPDGSGPFMACTVASFGAQNQE